VCAVGGQTLLPCSWAELAATAHVEWASRTAETVYEKWGERTWVAAEYRGRVDIPEEQLAAGNCSLALRDVQNMDAGVYDSYGIRGQGRVVSRVFVHSVRLRVLGELTAPPPTHPQTKGKWSLTCLTCFSPRP